MTRQKATQASGYLDPSFGEKGNAFYFPPAESPVVRLRSTSRLRRDGKIFSAGYYDNQGDLVLVRHLNNGNLDSSFGDGGLKIIDIVSGYRMYSCILALGLDDSAFISCSFGEIGAQMLFICKVLPDGELDPSFGTRGSIFLDLSPEADIAETLAIQPDGKILLTISSYENLLVRLDAKGNFDPVFGGGGIAHLKQGKFPSLIMLPDGRLCLTGSNYETASDIGVLWFARYMSNGVVDPDFGQNGLVMIELKNTTSALITSSIQQQDGKIVAVGFVTVEEKGYFTMIARINIDGSLDSTFNNGTPILTGPSHYSRGEGVAIQPDNKILVGSYAEGSFNLMRLLPNGALDMAFGVQGRVKNNMTDGMDKAEHIAVQADGKIMQLGRVELSTLGTGVGIARYFG